MKLKQVFYQESNRESYFFPIVRQQKCWREPEIIHQEIVYQYKVSCYFSEKLDVGIIVIQLVAEEDFFPLFSKGYSKKHLSVYPNSALAIREAIRLFDEAVAEELPDRGKTEEDAWAEWKKKQEPEKLKTKN